MRLECLGPLERPRRVIHVPDPDVGALQRKSHPLFGSAQNLGAPMAFYSEGDVIGHGTQC